MPAGRPKSISNDRVFDVAKPNRSKPVSTSRPVIVNHAAAVTDKSVVTDADGSDGQAAVAPSVSRKIIKPITITDAGELSIATPSPAPETTPEEPAASQPTSSIVILNEPKKAAKKVDIASEEQGSSTAPEVSRDLEEGEAAGPEDTALAAGEKVIQPLSTPVVNEEKPAKLKATAKKATIEPDVTTDAPQEEDPAETAAESEPKEREATDAEKPDDAKEPETTAPTDEEKPAEPDDSTTSVTGDNTDNKEPENSETGSIDALADASGKTKAEQKEADEQAKREAALQELIDSKKYFVPLAHDSTKSGGRKGVWMVLLVIILLAIGAYLAVDAKLISIPFALPYHFFKQ